jgi:zinc/manganese transport system permease protein
VTVASVLAVGSGIGDLLAHPFMREALLAGTAIAGAAGVVGYFVVLRVQVFSGDALSHVAFAGALAALAAGLDLRLGLFAATIGAGAVLGWLGHREASDVVVGTVFTWVLGLGVLFESIYATASSGSNGTAGVRVLFGSIFGLSAADARTAALIGVGVVAVTLVLARPLLFASVDPAVAAARGIPVRALGVGFLALVGACAAEATTAVGALLLVGLLAAPGATARRLTARPFLGLGLSAGLAVAAVWAGLTASYLVDVLPPSFSILAVATTAYAVSLVVSRTGAGAGATPAAQPSAGV